MNLVNVFERREMKGKEKLLKIRFGVCDWCELLVKGIMIGSLDKLTGFVSQFLKNMSFILVTG